MARDKRNLKAAYYRFHAVIASVAYFCAGFLMVSGPTLVDVLYDSRYAQAGWMLQILAHHPNVSSLPHFYPNLLGTR